MTDESIWKGLPVFVTGHTGFKGSWLTLWLTSCGARVHGYSLEAPTEPNMFGCCRIGELMASHTIGDVRDLEHLRESMVRSGARVVFHLAAQPIVQDSYTDPVGTYSTNIMGTVHLLEAVRSVPTVGAVVIVTSDKCYADRKWPWGYREIDRLGGLDPYSNSKACTELVTSAYMNSFFSPDEYTSHGVAIATVRAGNVLGGGDWAPHRLIPDCIRAFLGGNPAQLRNPNARRPWQHVLEPLSGYITVAERLLSQGTAFSGAWNFGPPDEQPETVLAMTKLLCKYWFAPAEYEVTGDAGGGHETHYLSLSSVKAISGLGWAPRWGIATALEKTVDWVRVFAKGEDLRQITLEQIQCYEADRQPQNGKER